MKALKDWTWQETQDYCNTIRCDDGCRFAGNDADGDIICTVMRTYDGTPDKWDLSEPPRFTDEEYRDMEVLARVIGRDDVVLKRSRVGKMVLQFGLINALIDSDAFPSLKPGETINIHDELAKRNQP